MSDTHIEDFSPQEGDSAVTKNNALVFWPVNVYGLADRLQGPRASAQKAEQDRLLVGRVIVDQVPQLAVVIYGLLTTTQAAEIRTRGLNIIGAWQVGQEAGLGEHSANAPVWITASPCHEDRRFPVIASIRVSSKTGSRVHRHATIVRYTVPNSCMLQYFALEPLRLGPVSGMKLIKLGTMILDDQSLQRYSNERRKAYGPSPLERKFFDLMLVDPVRWQKLKLDRSLPSTCQEGVPLRLAIEHINQMQPILRSLTAKHSNGVNPSVEAAVLPRLASVLTSTVEQFLLLAKACLNFPVRPSRRSGVQDERTSLASLLASAHQLDIRLSQLLIVPRLASRLRQIRKSQRWPTDEIAAPYIGLWNAVWLIANDVILGHVVSLFLVQHRQELAELALRYFEQYFLHTILWLLTWLGDWPAGLKLNTELSLFFGDAYTSLTGSWNQHFLVLVLPRLESVIVWIALAGRIFGVTMVFCLLQDLLAICTLHVTAFYLLSAQMMRFFVYVLSALFDLFRGKKRNALRGGRLDNASYELDQLLLGTTLFTLVAFLFPTVYVYYLAFGLVRLSVVGFEVAVTETCLGLLNHLPLFALMLRVKDPHRLPAGVIFDPEHSDTLSSAGKFTLRSSPMAWSDIFEDYAEHVGGVAALPTMLLRCIFGQPLRG